MKASETLTAMAGWFAEGPERWAQRACGYYDQPSVPACIDGRLQRMLREHGALTESRPLWYEAVLSLKAAIEARGLPPMSPWMWNDRYARDHRDVADLCHSAALIAKRAEDAQP